MENTKKRYSLGEEIASSVTHGIGALLSIAALVILIVHAVRGSPSGKTGLYVTGYTIFGVSLILLYTISTLYHALANERTKRVFGIFDHCSIYVLIAGTYTPFCLTVMPPKTGWTIFGIIWGLAALGIVLYSIFGSKVRALSAATYIVMGWLAVIWPGNVFADLSHMSFVLLLSGGIAYTIGVIFYALKKIPWTHAIWHLFVLAGSILHFFSLLLNV